MDLLCDDIVEEILRRLPSKYIHRVGAAARRYNLIVLSHGFRTRYWESHSPHLSGVFFQSDRPWGQHSRFHAGSDHGPSAATESMFASDLAFLPELPPGPASRDREIFIAHATAGLLLCSRGKYKVVQYFVCNPVTWQWVALPELPPPTGPAQQSPYGLLAVTNNADGSRIKSFQVALLNRHSCGDGYIDLMVFSSTTVRWEARRFQLPKYIAVEAYSRPSLCQSGTAYWIGISPMDKLIAYNCLHHTVEMLPVPIRVHGTRRALNRCIGERHGGALRYAHFDCSVFQVWDMQTGGVDGISWKLVHHVGVMELAERNPEATALVTQRENVNCLIVDNLLFSVLGFHPTADIIFLDVNGNVGAYSIEHGTITHQCPHQYFEHDVFPYVHPAHHVEIPAMCG